MLIYCNPCFIENLSPAMKLQNGFVIKLFYSNGKQTFIKDSKLVLTTEIG